MNHPQDSAIHIGDFIQFIRKRKKKYYLLSGVFALFAFGAVSLTQPKYKLQASFKEAIARSESASNAMLKTLLKTSSSDLGAQALSVMKSRRLVQAVIEELSLQGEIQAGSYLERLRTKIAHRYQLPVEDKKILCQCKTLLYSGKEIKRFYLHSHGYGKVDVISLQSNKSLRRELDGTYKEEGLIFSLSITKEFRNRHETLLLTIHPMEEVLDQILNGLRVKTRRDDVSVIDLAYQDSDPIRGVAILNSLMQEYQRYLLRENERIALAQMEYLNKRQEEISKKLDDILHAHVEYLEHNVGKEGLMGLHQELEIIEGRKKRHQQRILEIDFDLSKLHQMNQQQLFTLDLLGSEGKKLQDELMGLQKHKESFDSMRTRQSKQGKKSSSKKLHTHFSVQAMRQLEIQEQKTEAQLQGISNKLIPLFSSVNQQLHSLEQQRLITGDLEPSLRKRDFEGVDIEMAKTLHLEYTHQLDENLLKEQELELALRHLEQDDGEISSLFYLAGEGLAKEVIKETAKLKKDLLHEKYFGEKDRIRIQEHLKKNQQFLRNHFEEMFKLNHLKLQVTTDNLHDLQNKIEHLIDQQIILLTKQIFTVIEQKQISLEKERDYNLQKVLEAQEELIGIPQKWLMENRLQLQSDLNIGVMEGMSQLVESKNIEHHLLQVESKPIDQAYVPLKPHKMSVGLCCFLGSVLGLLFFMGVEIGLRVMRGFPLSAQGLKHRGLYAIGPYLQTSFEELEQASPSQLEMLRAIFHFLVSQEKMVAGLILSGKWNYGYALGKLLLLSGKKTLLVKCELSPKTGLVHYLKKETQELMIQQEQGLDTIPLGTRYSYEQEILHGTAWQEVLTYLQEVYDVVLFVTSSKAASAEGKYLTTYSNKMVITLDEENLDELYPYLRQETNHSNPFALYITFV